MAKILKLNAISPVANDFIPASYEYSDVVVDPDGIMVRSAAMKEYDFAANPSLVAIARAGAGVNNIPCDVCAQKGIVVFNTPGANANAVKELVLCQLLLGGRKIVKAQEWAQSLGAEGDNFSKVVEKGKGKFVGREVKGKTLGVVGLGAIGAMVANDALSLAAWRLDSRVKHVTDVKDIFRSCDYITLHVPATPDTKGMVNKETLALCKDDVVIVNDARADLVVNADILEAVESGKVSRYLTDFGAPELLGKENIVVFPHLGASTPEAEDNCAAMAAKELVDYIENGNILNSVNYPACALPRTTQFRVTVAHRNVKELLSKILSAVAAESINIANMQSASKGDYAYTILDLDSAPSDGLIAKIGAIGDVVKVRSLG